MLEYKGIKIPEKIIVLEPASPYYLRTIELYLEEPWQGASEKVFKIKDSGDDWYWPEDIVRLKYEEIV